MRKKYYYIYKTTNLINGKIYVGQRSCYCKPENDRKYLGSGIWITRVINKYSKENFKKEIIEVCNVEILDEREIYWIAFYSANNNITGYNIREGGRNGKHSKASKNLMRVSKLGRKLSIETKEKISKSCIGRKHTDEVKYKIGSGNRGKKFDENFRKNVSNGMSKMDIRECEFCKKVFKLNVYKGHIHKCLKNPNRINPLTENGRQRLINFLKSVPKQKCKYCDFESNSLGNLTRHHNENCKYKNETTYIAHTC